MTTSSRWQRLDGDAVHVYQDHLVPGMFAPLAPALIDLARIEPGERVLDIACGTGVITRLAARRIGTDSRGRILGLDISAPMLEVARLTPLSDTDAPIEWLEGNALALPLPDASFDVVLCQHGLQQLSDRPAALHEMRRVLTDDGRLAISVWSDLARNPGMAALVAALERQIGKEAADNRRRPFSLNDADELQRLLADAGFREIQIKTATGTTHFPSPEMFVEAQMAATPLATVGGISERTRQSIAQDVRDAIGDYLDDAKMAAPIEANMALALK